MENIVNFGIKLIGSLVKLIDVLLSSFINGIEFFTASMTTIPTFVIDLLNGLPSFFKVGLTGVFGLLLLVVFFKIFAIIKTS